MSSNGEWYNLVKIQDPYRESRMRGASVSGTFNLYSWRISMLLAFPKKWWMFFLDGPKLFWLEFQLENQIFDQNPSQKCSQLSLTVNERSQSEKLDSTDWPSQFPLGFSDLFSSLDNLIINAPLCTAMHWGWRRFPQLLATTFQCKVMKIQQLEGYCMREKESYVGFIYLIDSSFFSSFTF